jgi:SAM-dependent methyltransferase
VTEIAAAALARLYDLDLLEDPGDLDLYLALAARAGGPVLELAAGTGRLAIQLAEAGHEVTAVDIDSAMLARARARARAAGVSDRVHLIEADLRELELAGGSFGLAFIALNSLLVLGDRRSQASAVGALARHLAPGGIAVVDVWLPDADDLSRFDGRLSLEYPRLDRETGRLVTKIASALHDAATSTVRLSTIYEEGVQGEAPVRWFRQDVLRLVSADELRSFAEDAGLDVELIAGGYDLEPLASGSDRAVLVATRG